MRCKLIARNSSLIFKPLKLSINKFFLYYNTQLCHLRWLTTNLFINREI